MRFLKVKSIHGVHILRVDLIEAVYTYDGNTSENKSSIKVNHNGSYTTYYSIELEQEILDKIEALNAESNLELSKVKYKKGKKVVLKCSCMLPPTPTTSAEQRSNP